MLKGIKESSDVFDIYFMFFGFILSSEISDSHITDIFNILENNTFSPSSYTNLHPCYCVLTVIVPSLNPFQQLLPAF